MTQSCNPQTRRNACQIEVLVVTTGSGASTQYGKPRAEAPSSILKPFHSQNVIWGSFSGLPPIEMITCGSNTTYHKPPSTANALSTRCTILKPELLEELRQGLHITMDGAFDHHQGQLQYLSNKGRTHDFLELWTECFEQSIMEFAQAASDERKHYQGRHRMKLSTKQVPLSGRYDHCTHHACHHFHHASPGAAT